jgi:hypothetical protein
MKTYCVWDGDAGYRYWLLAPSKDKAKELVISNITDFVNKATSGAKWTTRPMLDGAMCAVVLGRASY